MDFLFQHVISVVSSPTNISTQEVWPCSTTLQSTHLTNVGTGLRTSVPVSSLITGVLLAWVQGSAWNALVKLSADMWLLLSSRLCKGSWIPWSSFPSETPPRISSFGLLSQRAMEKKFKLQFSTKYGIPKSLKVSHWLSELEFVFQCPPCGFLGARPSNFAAPPSTARWPPVRASDGPLKMGP